MIGHATFGVSDIQRSAAFYELAVAPLGMSSLILFSATEEHPVERALLFFIKQRWQRVAVTMASFMFALTTIEPLRRICV